MLAAWANNAENLVTSSILALSVVCLWCRPSWLWQLGIVAYVIVGIATGALEYAALLSIFAFGLLSYSLSMPNQSSLQRSGGVFFITVLAVASGLHILPGFNNWAFYQDVRLSENSALFSVWYNFDKPLVGLLVLGFCYERLIHSFADFWEMLKKILPVMIGGILMIYLLSNIVGYAQFDPKITAVFFPWAIKNILFTVTAEEVLFRGVIQNHLSKLIKHNHRASVALGIGALLFGVAHYSGGLTYVILASIAGLLYGYVYMKTNRIEAAILTHFLLNAGHFLFFTYPVISG